MQVIVPATHPAMQKSPQHHLCYGKLIQIYQGIKEVNKSSYNTRGYFKSFVFIFFLDFSVRRYLYPYDGPIKIYSDI